MGPPVPVMQRRPIYLSIESPMGDNDESGRVDQVRSTTGQRAGY